MISEAKARIRRERLAARRQLSEAVRNAESARICEHLSSVAAEARTVFAYVPTRTEPGTHEILAALSRVCPDVLLPVARTDPTGDHLPLLWARYVPGQLSTGPFGTCEPTGQRLPASALATADVVLVPALAVDRRGVRLGRGGGFYDRSLPLCPPGTRLIAVVRDDEILEAIPSDDHDIPMTHALTPSGGLLQLRTDELDGRVST